MLISREVFVGEKEHAGTILHWFLIECVGTTEQVIPLQDEYDVKFTIDGIEVDFIKVLEFFHSQNEKMIKEKAVNLIQERFTAITEKLDSIETEFIFKMEEELGLEHDY
jgi:hypothetical protein